MIQHALFSRHAWLAAALLLSACQNIPPYQPTTRVAPVVAPSAPQTAAAVETAPAQPLEPAAPAQPVPPPLATRNFNLKPSSRSLVTQAQTQLQSRDFAAAASNIERALRIEPQNPLLWIEYGKVRFVESNFAQAENMGRKAAALANGDARTQATAWRLVADSLQAQNKNSAAREASARADALSGR